MGNQLQLFEIEHAAPAPHHKPHRCAVCQTYTKAKVYCSRACRVAAGEPGYVFPVADVAPEAMGREVDV